jgi:hypothetical protein
MQTCNISMARRRPRTGREHETDDQHRSKHESFF